MPMHLSISRNKKGRDFVVGDIHGQFELLLSEMKRVGFKEKKDRLFSVGDIIDRGPDSLSCLQLLDAPWFYMVRGNHEQMMIDSVLGKGWKSWRNEYGRWARKLEKSEIKKWAKRLRKCPVAMTVNHGDFKFGLCHAEPDGRFWKKTRKNPESAQPMMWGRRVLRSGYRKRVKGVDITIHGHTPLDEPRWVANRYFIDTGAGNGDRLTLRNVADIHADYKRMKAAA